MGDSLVLEPGSRPVMLWHAIFLVAVIYNAICVPFRIAFKPVVPGLDPVGSLSLGCDVIYVLDMFFSCNLAFYDQGSMVYEPGQIRRRYFTNVSNPKRPSLLWDLISALPIDIIEVVSDMGGRGVLRLIRLLRLARFFAITQELFDRRFGLNAVKLLQLLVVFALLVHFVACMWYLFGFLEGFGVNTWVPAARLESSSMQMQYIESLYSSLGFIVGVVSRDEPDTIGEIIFHTVVMVGSLLFYAYAIGVVSAREESTNERALHFQAKMQYVRLVLKQHKLTPGLVSRVTAYLSYQYHNGHNFDGDIMEATPEGLRADIMNFIGIGMLSRLEALNGADKADFGFLASLVTTLSPILFMRNEALILENSKNDEMYFLVRGHANCLAGSAPPKIVGSLGPSDSCGDGMIVHSRSKHTVIATAPCECFVLTYQKMEEVLEAFPLAKAFLFSAAAAATTAATSIGDADQKVPCGLQTGTVAPLNRSKSCLQLGAQACGVASAPRGHNPGRRGSLSMLSRTDAEGLGFSAAYASHNPGRRGSLSALCPTRRGSLSISGLPPNARRGSVTTISSHGPGQPPNARRGSVTMISSDKPGQSPSARRASVTTISSHEPQVLGSEVKEGNLQPDLTIGARMRRLSLIRPARRPSSSNLEGQSGRERRWSSNPSRVGSRAASRSASRDLNDLAEVSHPELTANKIIMGAIEHRRSSITCRRVDANEDGSNDFESHLAALHKAALEAEMELEADVLKDASSGEDEIDEGKDAAEITAVQAAEMMAEMAEEWAVAEKVKAQKAREDALQALRDDPAPDSLATPLQIDLLRSFSCEDAARSAFASAVEAQAEAQAAKSRASRARASILVRRGSSTTQLADEAVPNEQVLGSTRTSLRDSRDDDAKSARYDAPPLAKLWGIAPATIVGGEPEPRAASTVIEAVAQRDPAAAIAPMMCLAQPSSFVSPPPSPPDTLSASAALNGNSGASTAGNGNEHAPIEGAANSSCSPRTLRSSMAEAVSQKRPHRSPWGPIVRILSDVSSTQDAPSTSGSDLNTPDEDACCQLPLVNPVSRFRVLWIHLVLVATLCSVITVPYRLGFYPWPDQHWGYIASDASCDFIFLCDFLLHFRLPFWRADSLVVDQILLLRHYACTTLPLNLCSVIIGTLSLVSKYSEPWFRTPLLLRLHQVPMLIDELYRFRDASNFSARKLTKLTILWLIMVHLTSCFRALVQRFDSDAPDPHLHGFRAYMHSQWWAVAALTTLSTISTPSTIPQLLYSSLVLVGSLFTSVYIIGNMGVLISNLDAAAVTFRKKREAASDFVRKQNLPHDLASRLSIYQECAWERGAGQNLLLVVREMNPTIRADIMHHICHSIFVTIPLFEACGPKFISALMETMQLEVFPQGEWICHKGSIATAMYIVMVGSVSVILDETRMLAIKRLEPGDFFGERSLFGREKRNASIQARTSVELVMLRADRFMQVLQLYPEVRRTIKESKMQREAETKAATTMMDSDAKANSHLLQKKRKSLTSSCKAILKQCCHDMKGSAHSPCASRRPSRTWRSRSVSVGAPKAASVYFDG